MASVASRGLGKWKGVGGEILKRVVVTGRHAATKSAELVKGTTLRDIYLKSKVLFVKKPNTPMPSSTTRHQANHGNMLTTRNAGLVIGASPQDNLWVEEADAVVPCRCIVVAHHLPLHAEANPNATHGFEFSIDDSVLPLQLYHSFPSDAIFVGMLPSAAIPASEGLTIDLIDRFSYCPVFLGDGLREEFDGFYEQYLLPLTAGGGGGPHAINLEQYHGFISATTEYADRVCDHLDPDKDIVVIHGYHLCALPMILRDRSSHARIVSTQS